MSKLDKKEYNKQYREQKKEKIKEQNKQWKEANKEHIKEYNKQYYKQNIEMFKYSNKEWRTNNKSKTRDLQLKYSFGITLEQYQLMYDKQNGACAICKQPETEKHQNGNVKSLAVDHSHFSGKIRELLCSSCNIAIGNFDDDIETIQSSINYLKTHTETI